MIRRAVAADAAALASIAERTFRDTFAAVNTAENMETHCRRSYGEAIQAAEIADANMCSLACEDHGRLIAYAQMRWGPRPACVSGASPGEIQRLYVDRPYHGKGIAHELMRACLAELERRGSDVAWLGVWERNPKAIAFYRKFGFAEVGEHVFPVGNDPQRDLVLVRPLQS